MKDFLTGPFLDKIKRIFNDITGKLSYIGNPNKNVIIKVFALAVGLIAMVSLVFIVLEVKDGKQPTTSTTGDELTETGTSTTSTTQAEIDADLKANILFCLDNETNDIHMLFLLQLDSTEKKANAVFIDSTSICQANNELASMNDHFKKGGITQLMMAVEKYTGLSVDRYLLGDEKALTGFVRELGDVQVNVKEPISYSHDGLSYIIDDGEQIMTPDILLKYIIYLADNRMDNATSLYEIICTLARMLFDCEDAQTALDNFGSVIGYFETNISAMDFSENKEAVMGLARDVYNVLRPVNNVAELYTGED